MNALIFFGCLALLLCVGASPILSESLLDSEFTTTTSNPLIEEAESKISQIIDDNDLTWRERNRLIDNIFSTLPPHLLPHLGLDSDFNRLPLPIYQRIYNIHLNEKYKLKDRRAQIRQILENLTWENRVAMQKEEFPLAPPTGFEEVMEPEIYKQLLAIHTNLKMSVAEKKESIDLIMSQVPKEVVDRLPLPQPMGKMPDSIQRNIRKIIYNFQNKWEERLRQFRQYIRTLPKSYRRILRSGWLKIDEISKDGAKTEQKVQPLTFETTTPKIVI